MSKREERPADEQPKKPEEEKKLEGQKPRQAKVVPFNPFYRTEVFPDALSVFSFVPKSLEEVKKDCLVVIDTNALLLPYKAGKEGLDAIKKVYQLLIEKDRLVIPSQVAREFAAHRFSKVVEVLDAWHGIHSKVPAVEGNQPYPLLEGLPEYKKAQELLKTTRSKAAEYSDAIAKLKDHIAKWYLTDPVSDIYRTLFTDKVVLDLTIEEAEVQKEFDYRRTHEIPPGYKDGERIGDYIIWKTILHLGAKKKPLIFVTGETKPDWVHFFGPAKQTLFPRYELIDEYRRASAGNTFHLLPLSGLLELFKADPQAVEEIKQEEALATGHPRVSPTLAGQASDMVRLLFSKLGFFVGLSKRYLRAQGADFYVRRHTEAGLGEKIDVHVIVKKETTWHEIYRLLRRRGTTLSPRIAAIVTREETYQPLVRIMRGAKVLHGWEGFLLAAGAMIDGSRGRRMVAESYEWIDRAGNSK